ncbi:MAG: class II glutamine amidotransferase [bacterium]
MCRLLRVKSEREFEIARHLRRFAALSKNSQEYQGHGWGCGFLKNNQWQIYKNIRPVWEDNLEQFGRTTQLIAHARSAFQNRGIVVENNMPFYDQNYLFIFNGELRGVTIKESGRTGAEKIFNYIKRFDKGDMQQALQKAIDIIKKRTIYVRAMNIIISDKNKTYVASCFNEDPDYFTLQVKQTESALIICSEKYPDETGWQAFQNNSVAIF